MKPDKPITSSESTKDDSSVIKKVKQGNQTAPQQPQAKTGNNQEKEDEEVEKGHA